MKCCRRGLLLVQQQQQPVLSPQPGLRCWKVVSEQLHARWAAGLSHFEARRSISSSSSGRGPRRGGQSSDVPDDDPFAGLVDWGLPFASTGHTTPVTLLSGFLGAGKTTLLKRLLENSRELKIGVIVNDVASVNVDAQMVLSHSAGTDGLEVVQLENGCVCCSISDDLFSSITTLLSKRPQGYDHLLIELSGVSDPMAVKKNWEFAKRVRHPAAMRSDIRQVLTLVDASCFASDWLDGNPDAEKRNQGADAATAVVSVSAASSVVARPVVELLAEQLEAADTVLVNKADLLSPKDLESVEALVSAINVTAEVHRTTFGDIDPLVVLGRKECRTVPIAQQDALSDDHSEKGSVEGGRSHGHSHGDQHGHSHSHGHGSSPAAKFGISSFVYRARRPFNADRFQVFCQGIRGKLEKESGGSRLGGLTGLLRGKGTCWLTTNHLYEHSWSFAGLTSTLAKGNPWWHAMSEEHREWRAAYPGMDKVYAAVRAEAWDLEGTYGDRRQELVFIGGPDLDEEATRKQLDECLLTEAEMSEFMEQHGHEQAPFELSFENVSMRA
mmetsp:Transcript_71493/g.149469  ORF Transcript_71493/g.149469 Transcript_71493/m.149469 type:complete len:555 (+) Transcript_71493:75-1739(+)